MPSGAGAGTNPIHNKKPKKKPNAEEDDEDKAYKAKQQAGADYSIPIYPPNTYTNDHATDKKAREDMAKVAGKKGAMNTGQQGIKKSGKK
ncbi:hypothetical protein EJ08DRAFT_732229 [Tothia fuscella]|uniref:Uncharacterized protein n=1 Tax=Tothia fuscella TaxID=1048955 RepID=A0A9P4NWX8_9PEZI|nr:hypothetical protein EJ08DRAFT_732229 [Tothia fuscella]